MTKKTKSYVQEPSDFFDHPYFVECSCAHSLCNVGDPVTTRLDVALCTYESISHSINKQMHLIFSYTSWEYTRKIHILSCTWWSSSCSREMNSSTRSTELKLFSRAAEERTPKLKAWVILSAYDNASPACVWWAKKIKHIPWRQLNHAA